jgi:hypothetical protein
VTVHVVPATFVTRIISDVLAVAVSATWNWVGGEADDDAAGNVADDDTTQVSTVPADGASVPPDRTDVDGWLA